MNSFLTAEQMNMTHTDEELMWAYIDGDSAAFRLLFERYAPLLMRLMRRDLPEELEAQDIVQQTFLQLHRARLDFRVDSKLRPWLMTIALNLKREQLGKWNRRRKRTTPPPHLSSGEAAQETFGDALDLLERTEDIQRIRERLSVLSDRQREVIELHWFEEMSFPEIAQLLGDSTSAVKVRAHRGYQKLKEKLQGPADARASIEHKKR